MWSTNFSITCLSYPSTTRSIGWISWSIGLSSMTGFRTTSTNGSKRLSRWEIWALFRQIILVGSTRFPIRHPTLMMPSWGPSNANNSRTSGYKKWTTHWTKRWRPKKMTMMTIIPGSQLQSEPACCSRESTHPCQDNLKRKSRTNSKWRCPSLESVG